jgi:hypothetical protein
MLHFFDSSSWTLQDISNNWAEVVKEHAPLYHEGNSIVLIGDGVKQAKEARKMPGVKKHHQDSEDSSKAEYIYGHMFGAVGILAGNENSKLSCIPLSATIQDGVKTIFHWSENETIDENRQETHIVQMIVNGFESAKALDESAILLLDRYFLSATALKKLNELNSSNATKMQIVTKAKKNCVAYEDVPAKSGKKGRPAKKGAAVKLNDLFVTKKESFKTAKIKMYGKTETVRYYCTDLIWGAGLYQKLRFVLVEYRGKTSILVSTDLGLDPETIIKLYSFRFKIECCFRELKQVIGGFSYRLWSKVSPKLKRFSKKDEIHPLDLVTDSTERELIIKKVRAIECYVLLSCIALGLLQILAFEFSSKIDRIRFQRTPSKGIHSEAIISECLQKSIFSSLAKGRGLFITHLITSKQNKADSDHSSKAS